jgi:hypothetical protein
MKKQKLTLWSIAVFALFFAASVNNSNAQTKVTYALIKPDSIQTLSTYQDSLQSQFGRMRLSDEKQAKSGNLAMLFSAIIPGSGQLYAHRYYTIPLIWGFGYYFYGKYKNADDNYKTYKSLYSQSLVDSTMFSFQYGYHGLREDWHNFRDEMGVYLVLTYLLNIIDAYVGATLYDFNVSDELGGNANIRFRIPLR